MGAIDQALSWAKEKNLRISQKDNVLKISNGSAWVSVEEFADGDFSVWGDHPGKKWTEELKVWLAKGSRQPTAAPAGRVIKISKPIDIADALADM